MDIDTEHLGIPDTVYDAEITMPAAEFQRIIRDLKELGESVKIEASKDGVRFSSDGDIGSASVTVQPTDGNDDDAEEEEEKDDEDDEDDEDEEEEEVGAKSKSKSKKKKVIQDDEKPELDDGDDVRPGSRPARPDLSLSLTLRTHPQVIIQDAPTASNSDAPAATATGDGKPDVDEKPEVTQADAEDDDEEDEPKSKSKKRKAAPAAKGKGKATGAAKKGKKDDDKPRKVTINLQQAVTLTFSIKYLSNFAKSTPLSETVHLHMSNEVPLLVEYPFPAGHIRYYLAPKISVRPSPPPPPPPPPPVPPSLLDR